MVLADLQCVHPALVPCVSLPSAPCAAWSLGWLQHIQDVPFAQQPSLLCDPLGGATRGEQTGAVVPGQGSLCDLPPPHCQQIPALGHGPPQLSFAGAVRGQASAVCPPSVSVPGMGFIL